MKTQCLVFETLLGIIVILAHIDAQRIRSGRCPAIQKRLDCPMYVWDDCTCDLDCPGFKKCCFEGCSHACLEADTTQPSVRSKADVVFVMDSSGSIGAEDYKREKEFVKELTNVFDISSTGARVSTIIYSDNPKLEFGFDKYQDKASINNAIDNLEFLGNRTRIDKALALALQVFASSRPSVPRIAFVLTDGRQTADFDAKPLDVAVRPLHDLGVQVYVVGIGGHVNLTELNLIAKRPQDVFTVNSFAQLLAQLYRIVNHFDTTDVFPPVEVTVDMLFLLDASSAVPQSDYKKEKAFLKNVIELFYLSPRYVRAGIIPYGSKAQLAVPLGRFQSNEAINRSIDSLPYIGGKKRLDRALQLANQEFSRARPLVPKIVIILTHGGQLTEPGTDLLRSPIQDLRNAGVGVFVIAIGDDVDITGLKRLVRRPNDVIADKSHEDITPYLPSLARYISSNTDFSTPLDDKADIIFIIDSSGDVEINDFKREREFVNSLAKSFKISRYGARASLISYGKSAYPMIKFTDYEDIDNFLSKMDHVREVGGARRMDLALNRAARIFKAHLRSGPRIVLLFTAGPQSPAEVDQLDVAYRQLENLGVRTYVIAIGQAVNLLEVAGLVNSSNDIFRIPSFIGLQSEVHAVGRRVSRTPGPALFVADIVFLIDSSLSVGIENYRREKDFVKAVSKALNHGEQASRSSLVVYSDDPRRLTTFSSHKTLESFKNAVERAQYRPGTRRLDKALEYAASVFTEARTGVAKIVVLLTSGRQTSAIGAKSLDLASRPLKTVGAKSFIAAIGTQPSIPELLPVVGKPDDIFRVRSFLTLAPKSNAFAQYVISRFGSTELPTTNVNADVIFLMDSSQTVTQDEYLKEKSFVKSMAKHLNVSPGKSRAAIITYGSSASVVRQLDSRSGFEALVDRAPRVGGGRRMDGALQEAAGLLFYARRSVPKIIVLLTAGTQLSGSPSPESAGRLVLSRGGRPFVIAIGREPDESVLRKVVERPEDVFKVPSFNGLVSTAGLLAKEIEKNLREVSPTPTVPTTNVNADVIFLMDSSQSVTQDEYLKEKSFVKSIARYLNVSPGKSRAAIITYGSSASVVRRLDSRAGFEALVDRAPRVGGGRRMDGALQEAAVLLSSARPSVPKIIVLLTAGTQLSGSPSPESAGRLVLSRGGRPFVVAIGREPDESVLRKVVERPEDVFQIPSFNGLVSTAGLLAREIEGNLRVEPTESPTESPTTNVNADVIFVMDSSQTVTQDEYLKEKSFVKSIAKHLNVSPGKSRAAIITYGSSASVVRQLDSRAGFEALVDRAPRVGGGRRMDRALQEAAGSLFYARRSVPKIIVLLTAGTQLSGSPSPESAGRLVLSRGGRPFVVAIGREPDISVLRKVVERPEDVFKVPSFNGLVSTAGLFAREIEGNLRVEPTESPTESPTTNVNADVIFVMDSSQTVTQDEYLKEKSFVKSMAKHLNVSPGKSRAAIITYGSSASVARQLDSRVGFEALVDRAPRVGGGRRMDRALQEAEFLLSLARQSVSKIIVLLTAGTQPSGSPSPEFAGRSLRSIGGRLFAIAIGSEPDETELRKVVGRSEDVFKIQSFNGLEPYASSLAKKIEQREQQAPPEFQGDVLFIMDSSSDVTRDDYVKEKDFVASLANLLNLSPSGTRGAVLTYGFISSLVADYNSYPSLSVFRIAVNRANYIGGTRRIDKALDQASQMITNARPLFPKIVVLLIAGRQSREPGVKSLQLAAKPLHEQGAKTFVVTIGNRPDLRELRPIVKDEKSLISVPSFNDLRERALPVANDLAEMSVPEQPESFQADYLFIVDSSATVSRDDYAQEKELVKSLTRTLDISRTGSRAALITYGSNPRVVFRLDTGKSREALEREIDAAPFVGGGRRIDRALNEGVQVMKDARGSVPKFVLLITAGRQVEGAGVQPLNLPGKALQETGSKPYVLEIGGRGSIQELRPVVKDSKDIFSVGEFGDLPLISRSLASQITRRSGPAIQDFVADFVFLVDSSITVDQNTFNRQKDFVKSMMRSLNVSPGKSRVAMATYGDRPVEVARLSSFKDAATFMTAVDNARYVAGRRRIDKALEFASTLLDKARPSVRRIVVLLTAGSQAPDPSATSLTAASQPLRDQGADRYVIAIGPDPDQEELTPIIDDPPDMFAVSSPEELTRKTQSLIDEIVKKSRSKDTIKPLDFDADVLFVVDSSAQVGRENYETEKDFVKSLAYLFNQSPGKTRVAVLIYSSTATLRIRFTDHNSTESFDSSVDSLPFLGRTRRLDEALTAAGSALNAARPSARKVVVLLTAGRQTPVSGAKPLSEAMEAIRKHGADTFVVAIGRQADRTELRPIVKDPSDIFVIPSFDVVMRHARPIAKEIANRTEIPPLPQFSGDVIFLVDSSTQVSSEDFSKEKDFVKALAKHAGVPSKSSRAAVILYDAFPRTAVGFESAEDFPTFGRAVDSLTQLVGRRRIDRALEAAARLVQPERPTVVVLITAGTQADDPGATPLRTAVQPLLRLGAKTVVVAVGTRSLVAEMAPVVEDPKDVFLVPNFDGLQSKSRPIASHIAEKTPIIYPPTDIVFLLDSSSDVSPQNYKKEKEFVASLAEQLHFGSGKTRIAVILYSSYPRLAIRFDVFKTPESLRSGLDGLPQLPGSRRIDRALDSAARTLADSSPNVRKVVILLTAGKQTQEHGVKSLLDAIKPLKTINADRFVVAIGAKPSTEELNPIVERSEDVFSVPSFDALRPQTPAIAEHITKERVEDPTTFKGDVIFLVDSSRTVPQGDFRKETDFVKTMARLLNVAPQKSRAAVVSYGDTTTLVARFTSANSLPEFEAIVDSSPYVGGKRRMDRAIEYSGTLLKESRRSLPKVVILLTAGRQLYSPDASSLYVAAKTLRDYGAKTFVVSIGGDDDVNEYLPLVKDRDNMFQIPSFDSLQPQAKSIADKVDEKSKLKRSNAMFDVVFLLDGSAAITPENFKDEKDFVQKLAASLNVAPGKSRAAVVEYGGLVHPQNVLIFDAQKTPEDLRTGMDRFYLVKGSRRIDQALDFAWRLFDLDGSNASKVVILLTAGKQAQTSGATPLEDAARPLKAKGVKTFILAIGAEPDKEELKPVVDDEDDIFPVPSFSGLDVMAGPFARHITNKSESKPPRKFAAEVVFVIDSSSDVILDNFGREKEFVKSMAEIFNVDQNISRAAIVTYGDRPSQHLTLVGSKDDIPSAVDRTPYIGGSRRMDRALLKAAEILEGARFSVPKAVILLTAGVNSPDKDALPLLNASQAIRDVGANLYVVTIGSRAAREEFDSLVENVNDIIDVTSFSGLQAKAEPTARDIAERAQRLPEKVHDVVADVVILVDSSLGVNEKDLELEKDFVKNAAYSLNLAPFKSRFAVVVYSNYPQLAIRFDDFAASSAFDKAVDKLPYVGNARRIDRALEAAVAVLRNGRPNVPKVVILLTAGNQAREPNAKPPSEIASSLDALKATTFVVAIGREPDIRELRQVATNNEDLFTVSSFQGVEPETRPIIKHIAERIETPPQDPHRKFDIVFLIDSSSGVNPDDYKKEKEFVKALATALNLAPDRSRVAILLYSYYARIALRLGIVKTPEALGSALDGLPRAFLGVRRMDRALETASRVFDDKKPDNEKVVVLLTAGRQSPGGKPLKDAVQPLRTIGATTYVVAIGRQVSLPELASVVQRPKDVIPVPSFVELVPRTDVIAKQIAERNETTVVDNTYEADVIFIADSSSRVSARAFELEKGFVKTMARLLNVSPQKSRAAFISYGSTSTLVVQFNGYSSVAQFDSAVDGAPYKGGSRRIDLVLRDAGRLLFAARKTVPKVVVLLTAGRQYRDPSAIPLDQTVRELREYGAKAFVVAIGTEPDAKELAPIVKDPQDIFEVQSFGSLKPKAKTIADGIVTRTTVIPENFKADVLFVMDSSSLATTEDFRQEKEFVKSMMRSFKVKRGQSRAAVITYGSSSMKVLNFDSYRSVNHIESAVDSATYIGGPGRLDKALQDADDLLKESNPAIPRIVVLFTSGIQGSDPNKKQIDEAAARLHDVGARVFVIAVGNYPDTDVEILGRVADQPRDVFTVPTFKELAPNRITITDKIATSVDERKPIRPMDFSADIIFIVDSSVDVSEDNHKKEKEFVKSLAETLNLDPSGSRAAVISYGTSASVAIRFDEHPNSTAFGNAVDDLSLLGSSRRMDYALQVAAALMNEARPDVPKVVVLLTAGPQSQQGGADSLGDAVKPLQALGSNIFVVAIGQQPDDDELRAIVEKPSDVQRVSDFGELMPETRSIAEYIVNNSDTSPQPRDDAVKVVFLVDSSSSVTQSELGKEKDFLKLLVRSLQFPLKDLKMAIVAYSSFTSTSGILHTYNSLDQFDRAADAVQYLSGPRKMDRALDTATSILRQDKTPGRNIVVLLTAGRQERQPEVVSFTGSTQRLQSLGASIYVVAIGSEPSLVELSPIVEDPRDIYQVPSFDVLRREAESIARDISSADTRAVDLTADIVFMVDSSASVGRDNYPKEKEFVKSLAHKFNVSPGKSRTAVIIYNISPILAVRLDAGYKSTEEFDKAVDTMPYLGGSVSRMDRALQSAGRVLNTDRPGIPKVAILLTAGRQAAGGVSLYSAAQQLRDLGATTFVIAIGQQYDKRELDTVVSKRDDLFEVPSFVELPPRATPVANAVAKRLAPEPEDIAADIVFLVDSSSSVTSNNFKAEKGFVKSLARSLSVSPDMSRASLIVYGYKPDIVLSLEEFKSADGFERAVDYASYVSGARRMDLALEAAAAVMNQGRSNVPKILVLVTAGRQSPTGDPDPLADAVEPLRKLGVATYVVAIGSEPDQQELTEVVEGSRDIFEVPTFGELVPQSVAIAKSIAEDSRPKPENITADVVFLVDTSSSIGQQNFDKEKRFVTSLARSLGVPSENSRAAVVSYSDTAITLTKLSERKSVDVFNTIVDDLTLLDGTSRIDKALEKAFSVLSEDASKVPKIVILLTGSQSDVLDSRSLRSSVQSLRGLGARTFIVAIGNETDADELAPVVERPSDLFKVTTFDGLQSRVPEIANDIATRQESVTEDFAADIVFLLDSSDSVTRNDFIQEKRFVKSLAESLNVAPGYSRAALVLFGTSASTAIGFNGYRTLADFNALVDEMSSTGGSRRMDRALEVAANVLAKGSRHTPKIVILVTSGRQTQTFDSVNLDEAVKPLERLDAKTFVVAVGRDPNVLELILATEKPDDVLAVPSFNDLRASVPRIAMHVTTRSTPEPQNITADIVFLVDASTSVGLDGFDKEKRFVKSLARSLNVSQDGSRAAVIAYSTTPRTVLTFTDYQTSEDFNQLLDRLTLFGGTRRIDRALEAAGTLLSQARPNVQKIVVLLTAGKQAQSFDAKPLGTAAQQLKNLNAKTFVVAVGREPDLKELRPIVDDAEDIFGVPSFDDLRPEVLPIAKHISESFEIPLEVTAEVVFVVDASTFVGSENFNKEKEFVKSLARSLNVSPGKSRAALITYSTNPFTVVPFGGYNTVRDFERKLDDVGFYGGERRMDRALMEAVGLFKNAKANVDRKIILLTSGRQTRAGDEEALDRIKKSLQDVRARAFIVTIGRNHDYSTLEDAVEDPDDIFKIPSFDGLLPNVRRIAEDVAQRNSTVPVEKSHPDVVFLVDSSSPLQPDHFQREKDFVKTLARSLNVGNPEKTKAAVISYGTQPSVGIAFDGYTTQQDFEARVDKLTAVQGSRRIDRALDEAANLLTPTNQSSPKIVVLLTAGRQAQESDTVPLDVAVQPLKDIGTKVYVVAIGNEPSTMELVPLVAKLPDIFRVPTYDVIVVEEPRIADYIKKETPELVEPPQIEVLFAMDSSYLVSKENYEREKAFVISMARALDVSPGNSKAAVLTYGDNPLLVMDLDDYSMPEFESIVNQSRYIGRVGRLDKAIRAAANVFATSTSSLPKIAIFLTAGTVTSEQSASSLRSAAQELRRLNVQRYVIAIGRLPDKEDLKAAVDDPDQVMTTNSFGDLPGIVVSVTKQVTAEPKPTPKPTPEPVPDHKEDIVFLMDSSSDVSAFNYYEEKRFVKSLARELKVSPTGNQAAVITYGNRDSTVVRFGSFSTLSAFDSAVDSGNYQGGARRLDRALEAASSMMSSRSSATRKTVVLLTGGRTSQEAGSKTLESSIQALRDMGAKIYIVAFGNLNDIQSLLPAVQKPQDIHSVPDIRRLISYVQSVGRYITSDTGPITRPSMKADIVFVMDSSYDVSQEEYTMEKRFITSLVQNLNVSPDEFRSALITYGNRGYLAFRFTAFQKLVDFENAVYNASYVGGERRIDKALDVLVRVLNEARRGTPKVVVFLTAGRQASGGASLIDAAEPLRYLGVKAYVLAIGREANAQELRPLVESPRDIVPVPSFTDLDSQTTAIGDRIIDYTVTLKPADIAMDVVFLLDSSDGVTSTDFNKEKEFVKLFAKRLNVSPGKTRAALIAYSSYSRLAFDLGDYSSVPEFERLVDGVGYIGGIRRMDKALFAASNVLRGSDPSTPKLVVLLTAGRQPPDAQSLVESAKPLQKVGAMVYVVSIGRDLNRKELEEVVGDPGHIHQVTSFDGLKDLLPQVTQTIIQGVSKRLHLTADVVFLMDASTAENSKYFQSQKDLIKAMVRNLAISPDGLRASLVVYSSSAVILADLDAYTTPERFEATVDRATYLGGARRMDEAMAAASRILSKSRPSATKIVVLITTGRQAQVSGMTPLNEASQALRDVEAHIYVIAIGKQPDIRELNLITEIPQDVVIIPSPDEVVSRVPMLSGQVRSDAKKGKQPALISKADLVFLLDSSDDVTPAVFAQEKEFIKSIARKFRIAFNRTRVAVVRYSYFASSVINFDSYGNVVDLVKGVSNIQYYGGRRRMDAALREASKVLQSTRPNVPTYVILMTAGRQAVPPGSTSLAEAAKPLLDSQSHVSVVAIGSEPDITELRLITKRDSDIFMVPSSDLPQQAPLVLIYMASQSGDQLPSDYKADILFLVDSSQSIGREKFKREIEFVKALARTLDLNPDKSRASVVTFGDTPTLSIRFDDYSNIRSFLRGVDVVPYMGGLKRLDKVLIFAARILSKGRPNAHKIAVLITDGKQSPASDPLDVSARPLHQLGVSTYVVGAGENADTRELSKIPSKPDDLFVSRSFDDLPRLVPAVVQQISDSLGSSPLHVAHALFLVDSSGYRSTSEFETQIDFIKSIAKNVKVSPTGTRAGVILYNGDPQLRIRFDDYDTLPEFYTLLDDLPLRGGGRELDKALLLAGKTLQTSPQGIPKYVVVLAEGQQLTTSGIKSLGDSVKPLQRLGATVYVVAIGNRLNTQGLNSMVQSPEDILTVTSFAELLRQVDSVAQHIGSPFPPCKETLDVGILIDASGSMGVDNFSREKNFVKLISRRLTSSSVGSRVGLMVFSDDPRLFVNFRDFERLTIDGFNKQVDELPYQRGRTRIDRALIAASENLFADRRNGVPQVLILITDGRQSEDPGFTPLARAIKPLQAQRVNVLAVGIGENINTEELKLLTGSADDVLLVQTFAEIDRLHRKLVSKACQVRK